MRLRVWRFLTVPCSHTPPTASFELTKSTSNILASYICKRKLGLQRHDRICDCSLVARKHLRQHPRWWDLIKTVQPCEESHTTVSCFPAIVDTVISSTAFLPPENQVTTSRYCWCVDILSPPEILNCTTDQSRPNAPYIPERRALIAPCIRHY